jgi:signal peptidase I
MLRALKWAAEPLLVLGIVLALMFASHHLVTPVRVGGWSMSPSLVPGDVVFVQLGAKPVAGDVVLVRAAGHEPVLHRAVELLDGGAVRTKGDANEVVDFEPARPGEVSGRGIAVLRVGAWIARWKGQPVYATMASQPNSVRR